MNTNYHMVSRKLMRERTICIYDTNLNIIVIKTRTKEKGRAIQYLIQSISAHSTVLALRLYFLYEQQRAPHLPVAQYYMMERFQTSLSLYASMETYWEPVHTFCKFMLNKSDVFTEKVFSYLLWY